MISRSLSLSLYISVFLSVYNEFPKTLQMQAWEPLSPRDALSRLKVATRRLTCFSWERNTGYQMLCTYGL